MKPTRRKAASISTREEVYKLGFRIGLLVVSLNAVVIGAKKGASAFSGLEKAANKIKQLGQEEEAP